MFLRQKHVVNSLMKLAPDASKDGYIDDSIEKKLLITKKLKL